MATTTTSESSLEQRRETLRSAMMSTHRPLLLAAPERSLTQRMEALTKANDIRSRRSELKLDLKASRRLLIPLLADPPDYLATMKLFDLLLAIPKYGRVKVNRILSQCRISPSKSIGGLTERQRDELMGLLLGRPLATSAAAPRPVLSSRTASADYLRNAL